METNMETIEDIAEFSTRDRSAARLRGLIQATDIAWITTPDGRIVEPQPGWEAYTGQSWEQYRDFGWEAAVHPDDLIEVHRFWAWALDNKSPARSRGRIWSQRWRAHRHFEAQGIPLLDGAGELIEWVGVCYDVEDRARAEEAAAQGERRKNEFIAMLAHELRNPLAPIRMAAHMLRPFAGVDPKLQWIGQVIERQGGYMERMLEDLLDVSRMERDKLELKRRKVALSEIIASASEASLPLLQERGQRLVTRLPATEAWVEADPTRMVQVFANLLNNAAKYMEDGGVVEVEGRVAGSEVSVSVIDHGVGISQESIEHVFDMFSQLEISKKSAQGGLGVGLALVRGLVELHGGVVQVQSAGLGLGAAFTVRLPLALAPGKLREPDDASIGEGAAPLRVLVADDNADAAETMAEILRMSGHEALVAFDGEQAVELAARWRPDVAILDINMPKLDGYQAAKWIAGRCPGAALIAASGWASEEHERKSRDAGFSCQLLKPISPEDLLAAVAEAAAGRESGLMEALRLEQPAREVLAA